MRNDSQAFAELNEAPNRCPRQVARVDFDGAGDYIYITSHSGITGFGGATVYEGYIQLPIIETE